VKENGGSQKRPGLARTENNLNSKKGEHPKQAKVSLIGQKSSWIRKGERSFEKNARDGKSTESGQDSACSAFRGTKKEKEDRQRTTPETCADESLPGGGESSTQGRGGFRKDGRSPPESNKKDSKDAERSNS